MKRRSFIRHVSHALAVPGVFGSLGLQAADSQSLSRLLRLAADTDRVLVLIFLEGGNDGLNTVIPLQYLSELNQVRPHVILPDNRLLNLNGNHQLALHPALDGFKSLFDEGRLQIIQNVGYPDQNYSHFRSTDIWMSASDANVLVNSGWSGRFLNECFPEYPETYPNETMTDPLAIELGYGSSLVFQGPLASMSMVISSADGFYRLVENEAEEAPNNPAGAKLQYIRTIARQANQYGDVVKAAANKVKTQKEYPLSNLGQQLKIVSRLIAGGLRTPLYMVRLGGFDTHDAQVESDDHTTGEHADLLRDLNDSVVAFVKDMEYQGTADRVVGMTFSEFGRRIVSNASLGTDHGAAAPLFFFGNAVKGGIIGKNPVIPRNATYENNLPWEFDFRQLYASILDQWLGATSGQLENSMLSSFDRVEVIRGSVPLDNTFNSPLAKVSVFPNPLDSLATIEIDQTTEPVSVEVLNLQGQVVQHVFAGLISTKSQLNWDASRLPNGHYIVVVRGASTRRSCQVIKRA